MTPLKAGLAYVLVVFVVGFALGTVRVLMVAPRLGATAAVLIETPIMLAASWAAARACVRGFGVRPVVADRLVMGGSAFALLMAAEAAVSILIFGRSPAEHLAAIRTTDGAIGLGAQVAFALFPLLARRTFSARHHPRAGRS